MFRLAWSERGAPRVILPVFRLAWSERGAPRRAARWLERRVRPAFIWGGGLRGAADAISRTPTRNAPEAAARAVRAARSASARAQVRTKPGIAAASIGVDLEAGEQRFAMAGLRPDFPGLPGMGGGV